MVLRNMPDATIVFAVLTNDDNPFQTDVVGEIRAVVNPIPSSLLAVETL